MTRRSASSAISAALARARSAALLEGHRRESNPALEFLSTHYVADPSAPAIPAKAIYVLYRRWHEENGYQRPLAAAQFGKEVQRQFPGSESRGVKEGRVNVTMRFGLRAVDAEWR